MTSTWLLLLLLQTLACCSSEVGVDLKIMERQLKNLQQCINITAPPDNITSQCLDISSNSESCCVPSYFVLGLRSLGPHMVYRKMERRLQMKVERCQKGRGCAGIHAQCAHGCVAPLTFHAHLKHLMEQLVSIDYL